jgi:hypothetical protein
MPKLTRKRGSTANIAVVFLQDSSSTTGAGKTGLTNASAGLTVSVRRELSSATTNYTSGGGTIDSITTLGAWAAPTAGHCRFKEISSSNQPGMYELQFEDALVNAGDASRYLTGMITATGIAPCPFEIELTASDLQGNVASDVQTIKTQTVTCTASVTMNANVGTTQPVNFAGTGASALVKADLSASTAPPWVPPLTLFRDAFTRPTLTGSMNGRPLEIGAANHYAWDADGAGWVVSGGQVANYGFATADFNSNLSDQIRIRAVCNLRGSASNDFSIIFRCGATQGVSGYWATVNGNTQRLEMYRTDGAGNATLLTSLALPGGFDLDDWHLWEAVLNGTTMTATIDGVFNGSTYQVSTTSATFQGNTWVGMGFNLVNGGTANPATATVSRLIEGTTLAPTNYSWPVSWYGSMSADGNAAASAILTNATTEDQNIPGTLGYIITNAPSWFVGGGGTDPLTNTAASYSSPQLGYLIGKLAGGNTLVVTSLYSDTGDINITQGADYYLADNRQIDIVEPSVAAWPPSINGPITLYVDGQLVSTGSLVAGTLRTLRFELPKTVTQLMPVAVLRYVAWGVGNSSHDVDITRGRFIVNRSEKAS